MLWAMLGLCQCVRVNKQPKQPTHQADVLSRKAEIQRLNAELERQARFCLLLQVRIHAGQRFREVVLSLGALQKRGRKSAYRHMRSEASEKEEMWTLGCVELERN